MLTFRTMRKPGMAEHLRQFEVLGDRRLGADTRPLCRLHVRDLDGILRNPSYDLTLPYDVRFGKMMVKAVSHVLALDGLGAIYGFAEFGEASLVARPGECSGRELLCRIVAEASAKLSLLLGAVVAYDAQLYEFPNQQLILQYFRWRQHEAVSEALDRYCEYVLQQSGTGPLEVPGRLAGLAVDDKVELLRQHDIDYRELPLWQRRGTGVIVRPDGTRLVVDTNLPEEEAYAAYLRPLLT